MSMLKTYQEQLQDMVNKGIDAAEKQQKRLSAKPFDMAEKLEEKARAHSVKSLRKSYYGHSENIFDQLRELNVTIAEFTTQLISRVEKEVAEGADSVEEVALEVAGSLEEVAFQVAEKAEEVKEAVEPAKSDSKSSAKKTVTAKTAKAEEEVKVEDVKPAKASTAKADKVASV